METTSPSERPGAQRYSVLAVEPDERMRTRITLELAGIVPAPLPSIDAVTRELVPGEPTVLVFGPSLAQPEGLAEVERIARSFPEVGVVLLADELTLPLLQDALRAVLRESDGMINSWPVERVFRTGDAATGTTVLTELYQSMRDAPSSPDLHDLWRRLGVHPEIGAVRLEAGTKEAEIRDAITHRPAER
jgi:hypothetical protein